MTVLEDRVPSAAGGELKLVDLRTAADFVADKKPRRRLPRGIERLLGVVLVLALWQVAAWAGWISPKVLAGPVDVASTFRDLVADGTLGTRGVGVAPAGGLGHGHRHPDRRAAGPLLRAQPGSATT